MILFETERLIVKRFTLADSSHFFEVNGSEEVMRHIRPAKTLEQSDAFLDENIRLYSDDSILGRFAVFTRDGSRFVGAFSFLYLSGDAGFHLGYALVPAAWNHGYATELVRAGIPFFFRSTQHDTIFAITTAANTASQKVLLKAGFAYEGQRLEDGKPIEVYALHRPSTGVRDIGEG